MADITNNAFPEISKITLPSGTTYSIKDEIARQMASAGVSFTISTSAANTPKDVTWDNDGTTITGTLVASASTTGIFYLVKASTEGGKDIYAEYVTVKNGNAYLWEKIGTTDIDLSDLGNLAYKDNVSVNVKPEGTVSTPTFTGNAMTSTGSFVPDGEVSKPTFTGSEGTVSVSGTPAGTISVGTGSANYTPAGTVSAPTITVTPSTATKYVAGSATGGGSVTAGSAASCTLPTLATSVSDETLTLSWTDGSFTPNTPTAVTLPSFTSQTIVSGIQSATSSQPTFTGTGTNLKFSGSTMSSSGSFTPAGSVSKPTFTGTSGSVSVSGTPTGTVSQPTFTGTQKAYIGS
jgi:hypothetical protein